MPFAHPITLGAVDKWYKATKKTYGDASMAIDPDNLNMYTSFSDMADVMGSLFSNSERLYQLGVEIKERKKFKKQCMVRLVQAREDKQAQDREFEEQIKELKRKQRGNKTMKNEFAVGAKKKKTKSGGDN